MKGDQVKKLYVVIGGEDDQKKKKNKERKKKRYRRRKSGVEWWEKLSQSEGEKIWRKRFKCATVDRLYKILGNP